MLALASTWAQVITTQTIDVGGTGQYNSQAIVNGNPAISYYDVTNGDLKYVRASDSAGTSWGTPVTLDSTGDVGTFTSLAVVDGNPAISYYDVTNGNLKYVRATTASGTLATDWSTPIAVDSTGNVGQHTSLKVVNGNPAISYYDQSNSALKYVRATTASGTLVADWGTPVALDSANSVGQHTSLAVVNGNPAISYLYNTGGDLRYVRATTASGTLATDWGTPVTVDSVGTVGFDTSLAVVNGNPAISYYDLINSDLKYVRATTASGTLAAEWGTPVTVDSSGTVGANASLAVVNGNPAISYYDGSNTALKYVRATTASGTLATDWDTPVTVDSIGTVGIYSTLTVVNGSAAIGYHDTTNANLKWATLVFPPTVASISPTSGSTAGGASVTLTGTGFTGATGVTIGGVAATSVNVVSDTSINCTTPAGSAGTASVVVTTPNGSNAANTLFTYVTPPTVTLNAGFIATNATTLTITGTGFSTTPEENTVVFSPAGTGTVTGASATSLTVTSLSGLTAGALNAVVTTNSVSSGSAVQVATVFVLPTVSANLVAQWVADDWAGGTNDWVDRIGGKVATVPGVNNSPTKSATGLDGMTALVFDGVDDYLRVDAAQNPIVGKSSVTIVAYFNTTRGASGADIAFWRYPGPLNAEGPAGPNDWGLTYNAAGDARGFFNDEIQPPTAVNLLGGQPHTMILTWKDPDDFPGEGVARLYVDGELIGSTGPNDGGDGIEDNGFVIGSEPEELLRYFSGAIRELRFYDAVLDPVAVDADLVPLRTLPATFLTGPTGTLNGSANPQGAATTAWFEYGTDPALSGAASTTAQDLGSGSSSVAFNQEVTGLAGDTTYYFRAVTNTGGATSFGSILSFSTGPELALEQPAGTNLTDGAATVSFGDVPVGIPSAAKTFIIRNTGIFDLTGITVMIDGAFAGDYLASAPADTTVPPGGSTTFSVIFTPGAAGVRTAALHIGSNDADENPFDLVLDGTGLPTTIWTGPRITFTKDNYADWNQEENQDRLTPAVWLTRQNAQGIYNIVTEASFDHSSSPADTEWAYGTTADLGSLTFSSWRAWHGNFPPGMIDQDAVLHLISENIYIDIKFTFWQDNANGGGFSYSRSTPAVGPEITSPTSASITAVSALLGGEVTSDGDSAIIERGVVYSATATNSDPLIDGLGVTKVTASGTTGVFTAAVSLSPGTAYSYKAYATNSGGTTYTSVATFATPSNIATLSGMALSSGTLSPTFASGTSGYTARVSNGTTSITVTPTVTEANATVKVNTVTVTSGSPSGAISLNVGSNTITTVVTAQDGTTTGTYTVDVTRDAVADYAVTTSGNAISITDSTGNGDTLAVSEPSAGNISFAATGRTFSIDGGLSSSGDSGSITRTGVTTITVDAGAGADTVNVGAFTGTLPTLTLNGGIGNDTVNLNGSLTFASNANLDVDLQNDDVTPGIDAVNVAASAVVAASGTGTITVRVSQSVALATSAVLSTVNGALTIEANIAGTNTNTFDGVTVDGATIQATGSGNVTVVGKGGTGGGAHPSGVVLLSAGKIIGGTSGTVSVTGTGGTGSSTNSGPLSLVGVKVMNANSVISSTGANVQVTGFGGTATGDSAWGILVYNNGTITAGGTGSVTVAGTGGSCAGGFNIGVLLSSNTTFITSANGPVQVTGVGGVGGDSNHGVMSKLNGKITAGGTNAVTVTGTGGSGTGGSHVGVLVTDSGSQITSGGGNITVTGTPGTGGTAGNGVQLISSGALTTATNGGNITVIADTMGLSGPVSGNGSSTVALRQKTNGVAFGLGSGVNTTPSTVELSDAELDNITAGTVVIGDANTGAITTVAAITHPNNLSLITGAGLTVSQALTMAVDKNLTFSGVGTVNVTTAITATGTGAISLTTARNVSVTSSTISTVNGNLTVSANQQTTPTSATFDGIDVNAGSIQVTGSGTLTLAGRGGVGGGADPSGVLIRSAGVVSGGTSGTVSVTGTGGTGTSNSAGTSNLVGVSVDGTNSRITSTGANVQVTGIGGTSTGPSAGGVLVISAGTITAGGTGSVTVSGTGGSGTEFNYGVDVVNTSSLITSSNGPVQVTGTGGSGGNTNFGVLAQLAGKITSGGANTLTVTGTGGSGSGGQHHGVIVQNGAASQIASGGGNLLIDGTAGTGGTGSFGVTITAGSITTATNGGSLTLVADKMNLGSTVSANSSSTVTLRQKTNAVAIDLGSAVDNTGSTLELSDAELDFVTAGTLAIGDANSGLTTVTAVISPGSYPTLDIQKALTFSATGGFAADVASATVFEKLRANGAVIITAGATLTTTATGGYSPAVGSTLTILNNLSASTTTGIFSGKAEGANVTIGGVVNSLSYAGGTGNDVVFTALPVFDTPSGMPVTNSGVIAGGVNVMKTGTDTLTLSGLNTYTGSTGVEAGTLSINTVGTGTNAQSLGAGNVVNLGVAGTSSGSLVYTGGAGTLDKTINALGNGADTVQNSGSGLLTLSGTLNKAGTTLTLKGGANGITVSGTITGNTGSPNSDLVVDGGVVTLTNANTYNGPTYIRNSATLNANAVDALPTLNGRTHVTFDGTGTSVLSLGTAQSVGSLTSAGAATVTLNANTLTLGDASGSTTFAGIIGGTGGLIKDGASTQILTGANNYTGTTTISAGTLQFTQAGASSSHILNGGTLQFNFASANYAVTTGLTFNADSTIGNLGQQVNLNGTLNGNNRVLTVDNGASTNTLYFNGAFGSALSQVNIVSGIVGEDGSTGTPLRNAAIAISSGAGFGTYNTITVNNNITLNGGAGANGNGVLQNQGAGTATYSGTINLNSGTSSIGTAGGNIAMTNVVSGGGSLTKIGANTLTLSGANTYTGTTTVSGGTLNISGAANTSTSSSVVMANSSNLVFTATDGRAFTGSLTGSAGTITFNVAGDTSATGGSSGVNFDFNNSGSFTGTVVVNSGLLGVRSNAVFGDTANVIQLNAGSGQSAGLVMAGDVTLPSSRSIQLTTAGGNGIFRTYASSTFQISGQISGAGNFVKTDSGTVVLDGTNTYTGTTTVGGGTLQIGSGGTTGSLSTSSAIINNSALVFNRSDLVTQGTAFASVISGSGTVTQAGSDMLILNGINTYSGATTVSTGVLSIRNADALGSTAAGTTVSSGAALQIQGVITTAAEALTLNGTGISNDGALRNITGSNTYAGLVTLGSSTRINSDSFTLGLSNTGTITGAGFGLTVGGSGNTVIASIIGTGSGTVTKDGAGTLTLSGANTYTGVTTVSAGTLRAGSASAFTNKGNLQMSGSGVLDLGGHAVGFINSSASATTNTITNNGSANATLNFSNLNTQINSLIQDGTRTLGVSLRNDNSGVNLFKLDSANTFTGGVTLLDGSAVGSGLGSRVRISNLITTVVSAGAVVSSPFGTGAITIGEASTDKAGLLFDTTSNNTLANAIVFNTARGTDHPGIRVDSAATGLVLSGQITANLANAIFSNGTGGVATVTLTGQVTGASGLETNASPIAVTLNNAANNNDYAGNTITGSGSFVTLGRANQIPNGAGKGNVVNAGTLNLNGFNETINGLSGAGIIDGVSGTPTLTIGDNDAGTTYSGVIRNTAGTLALTKTGAGTMTLDGTAANTYTGTTTISGGVLVLNKTGAGSENAIAAGGSIVINSGGTLRLGTQGQINDSITNFSINGGTFDMQTFTEGLTPQISLTNGSITGGNTGFLLARGGYAGSGSNTISKRVSVRAADANSGRFDITSGTTTASGIIYADDGGAAGITKTGAGTLVLSGANAYTGGTTISAGVLNIQNATALGTTAGSTSVGNGATLQLQGGITVGAEALSLNGGAASGQTGALVNVSGTNTYGGAVTVTASSSISAASGSVLNLTGGVVKNGTTATFNGGGTINVGTVGISGASANSDLVIDGTTVNLNVANTYNGPTFIRNSGTLNANVVGALPTGTRSALTFDGTVTSVLALGANQSVASLTSAGAATVTLGANTLTVGAASGSTTFAGVIGGTGGLTKDGASTQVLSGASTFSGAVTVNAGTILAGNKNALGATSTSVTKVIIASGGTVDLNGVLDIEYGYTIAGTGAAGAGALINTGAAIGTGYKQTTNLKLAADATIGGTGDFALLAAGYAATSLDLAGFTLTKAGTNTFSLVNATLTAGTIHVAGGTLTQTSNNKPGGHDGSSVAFSFANTAGATLALNDLNFSTGSLSGGGSTGGNVTLGTATLTTGALGTSTSYAGVISGSGGLTKAGTGTQVLSGSNTYTGATTVSAGVLNIQSATGLGTTATGTSVSNGATLQLQGGITVGAEALSLNGGAASGQTGALVNVSGTNTYGGAITVTASSSISAASGSVLNLTGGVVKNGTTATFNGGGTINVGTVGISGASANSDLVIDGTTVNLNVANTYNGPTFIRNSGTLNANVTNALPTANGRTALTFDGTGTSVLTLGTAQSVASLTSAGAATVTLGANTLTVGAASGSTTFAGSIGGIGGLTKDGASTLTLSGSNGYTGATLLSAGSLVVNGSIGSSSLTTIDGGTLLGTGTVGTIQLNSGAAINPGGVSSAGTLNTGNISIVDGQLAFNIGGTGSHDRINTTGTINLTAGGAGAQLVLNAISGYVATLNNSFTLVTNDLADTISGAFAKGTFGGTKVVTLSGVDYVEGVLGSSYYGRITYNGGDGNDLVLKVVTPEITITETSNVADGSTYDFGSVDKVIPTVPVTKTFTIKNDGEVDLTGIVVNTPTGAAAADYTVNTTGTAAALAPGASTTFTITFDPTRIGIRNAALVIDSNDLDENPFNIALTGLGNIARDVNLVWMQSYGGPDAPTTRRSGMARAVAVQKSATRDEAVAVFATGHTTNAAGNKDIYTARYHPVTGDLIWSRTFNGPPNSDDEGWAIALDSSGNVVITGYTSNGGINWDVYTAKYANADGALMWSRTYAGAGGSTDVCGSVAVDSSGNVAVAGCGIGASLGMDIFVARYAGANGAPIFERLIEGGNNRTDSASSVAVDSAGNVAVGGYARNASNNKDFKVLHLAAATGATNWQWNVTGASGADDESYSVAFNAANEVIATGTVSDSNSDLYTVKLSSGGALVWEQKWNSSYNSSDAGYNLAVDSQGNVLVAGTSFQSSGYADGYVVKFNGTSGAQVWNRRFDGAASQHDVMYTLSLDVLDNVVATGVSQNANGSYDIETAKMLSGDGAVLWDRRFDGAAGLLDDYGFSVAVSPDGNVFVGGYSTKAGSPHNTSDFLVLNYNAVLPTVQTAQTIAFANPGAQSANTPVTLTASATSGLPVSFSVVSGPATLDAVVSGRLNFTGNGPVTVRASQSGSAVYAAATPVDQTFTVNRSAQTISFVLPAELSQTAQWPLTGVATSGLAVTYSVDSGPGDVTGGILTFSGAGLVTVRASQAGDSRFNSAADVVAVVDAVNNAPILILDGIAENWRDLYAGSGAGEGNDMALQLSGNDAVAAFVAGYTTTATGKDVYLAKYNDAGVLQWNVTSGTSGDDEAMAVVVDGNGDAVIAGYTTGANGQDVYVAKHNGTNGNRIWSYTYNGAGNLNDVGVSLALDGATHVVVGGYAVGAGTSNDFFAAKLALAGGGAAWTSMQNRATTFSDLPARVVVGTDGSVVLAGISGSDAWTVKLAAADGTRVWQQIYNFANKPDAVRGLELDGANNVIIAAYSQATNYDMYTAKYSALDGTLIWGQRYNSSFNSSDAPWDMTLDEDANVYVTGTSYRSASVRDGMTLKYSGLNGTLLWEGRYNSPNNTNDENYTIALDGIGNPVVSGYTTNTDGTTDVYLAKHNKGPGDIRWQRVFDAANNKSDIIKKVRVDPNGNVWMTGAATTSGGQKQVLVLRHIPAF